MSSRGGSGCKEQESDEGDPLQGGPVPTREHAHGGALVCGVSRKRSAWRSTPGGARGAERPRAHPARGRAIHSPMGRRVAAPPAPGVGQRAPGRAGSPGQRAMVFPRAGRGEDRPAQRDAQAATRVLTKARRRHGGPEQRPIDGRAAQAAASQRAHAEHGTASAIRPLMSRNTRGEQEPRGGKRGTRPLRGGQSCAAAPDPLGGIERRPMLKQRPLMVEAGAEGRTAVAPFDSLAASSPHRQGQLPLHHLLSKICDTTGRAAAPDGAWPSVHLKNHHGLMAMPAGAGEAPRPRRARPVPARRASCASAHAPTPLSWLGPPVRQARRPPWPGQSPPGGRSRRRPAGCWPAPARRGRGCPHACVPAPPSAATVPGPCGPAALGEAYRTLAATHSAATAPVTAPRPGPCAGRAPC
jgi:hypothetical protein